MIMIHPDDVERGPEELNLTLAWVNQYLNLLHRNGFINTINKAEAIRKIPSMAEKLESLDSLLKGINHIEHPSLARLREIAGRPR